MQILRDGMVYTFEVMTIQQNAEQFNKTRSGTVTGTSHCHFFSLKCLQFEDEELYAGQICTDHPQFTLFEAGDTVKLRVNKFAKQRYTFYFVEVSKKAESKTGKIGTEIPLPDSPLPGKVDEVFPPIEKPYYNPVITGTLRERALGHAVHLHHMRPSNDEEVLESARKFLEFLKES